MKYPYSWLVVGALSAGLCGPAAAQTAVPQPAAPQPATQSTAQIDAGEPRADTSGSVSPAGATQAAAHKTAAAKAAPAPKAPGAADRLNLGTATVTGDREQPKVMYIVPWKKSDIGDLSGKPMNSLLDEALAPVDRDEFKREVAYFDAVKADTSQNKAGNGPAKQVEK